MISSEYHPNLKTENSAAKIRCLKKVNNCGTFVSKSARLKTGTKNLQQGSNGCSLLKFRS